MLRKIEQDLNIILTDREKMILSYYEKLRNTYDKNETTGLFETESESLSGLFPNKQKSLSGLFLDGKFVND